MKPEIVDHVEGKENGISSVVVDEAINSEAIEGAEGNSGTNSNDSTRPETSGGGRGGGGEDEKAGEINHDHVIDIIKNGANAEHLREEKVCRICHLSVEPSSGGSELIQLGCHCRAELGISHRHCAETWFKQRGNRVCEICGVAAKNVEVMKTNSRICMVDFDEMRPIAAAHYASSGDDVSDRCKQSCCNFLLACLVLGLVVPWFFRLY